MHFRSASGVTLSPLVPYNSGLVAGRLYSVLLGLGKLPGTCNMYLLFGLYTKDPNQETIANPRRDCIGNKLKQELHRKLQVPRSESRSSES